MNILFVLYGDLEGNSAIPLGLHAREFIAHGHACAVAVPLGDEVISRGDLDPRVRAVSYRAALADPNAVFVDGRAADVILAWTPRECVRRFVTSYQSMRPTPWVIYLEDNEEWLAKASLGLVGIPAEVLYQHSEEVISAWTPEGLPHVLHHGAFVGLADAAAVIQGKLALEVPPWVPCETVMPGVDLARFRVATADDELRRRLGVRDGERLIVYPGGLNDFTRSGLETLCRVVGLVNDAGISCRLLRTGPVAFDFLDRLPPATLATVTELGVLPRADIPALLALADVLVQPGTRDEFDDLRLPGKLPEFFASGRPVVLPDANIAEILVDGENAVFHRSGSAEEIAERCIALFGDPELARRIGDAGRRFAEAHFDASRQAARLERTLCVARERFDPGVAAQVWSMGGASEPTTALLARRLRLMSAKRSSANGVSATMLAFHARTLDKGIERSQGLETGMAVRDHQIARLKEEHKATLDAEAAARALQVAALTQQVAGMVAEREASARALAAREEQLFALENSLTWRATRPVRKAVGFAMRLVGRGR